jgi:hypothetical protein
MSRSEVVDGQSGVTGWAARDQRLSFFRREGYANVCHYRDHVCQELNPLDLLRAYFAVHHPSLRSSTPAGSPPSAR